MTILSLSGYNHLAYLEAMDGTGSREAEPVRRRRTGASVNPRKDLTGRRFGRLVVLGFSHRNAGKGELSWRCVCDCGTVKAVRGGALAHGTVSCGCYSREHNGDALRTHGRTNTPEFRTWSSMLLRAHTGAADCAHNYLGRGITVCERWLKFENFAADMGKRPSGTTLDRINNDGNYEPGNCRWATPAQQRNNSRTTFYVTAFGRKRPVVDWAQDIGVSPQAVKWRLRQGWPAEEAVSRRSRFA